MSRALRRKCNAVDVYSFSNSSADVYTDDAPVFAPDAEYQVGVVGDAWRRLIDNVTISTLTVDRPEKKVELSVPPSFVEHEQEQLRIGRKSKSTGEALQSCSFGDQCAAFCLTGNNKPLHPYLTASQQEEWDRDGTQTSGPCLLCIRRTVTSVAMLYKRDSIAVSRENPGDVVSGRNSRVFPCPQVNPHSKLPCLVPFYNTIDEAGGYRREYCIMPSDIIFLPGPMCAYNTGALRFVPTATDATGVLEGFVDQGAAVYNPTSSN